MSIEFEIAYSIRRFISDFLDTYGIFTYRNISKLFSFKIDQGEADEETGTIYENGYNVPFEIHFGLTKVCLSFYESDKVFKIPFYSCMATGAETALIDAVKTPRKNGRYTDFSSSENLCAVEVEIYNRAKEMGIEKVFAAEALYMTYQGVPVYWQEKMETTFDDSDHFETNDWDIVREDEETCEFAQAIEELSDGFVGNGLDELEYNVGFLRSLYNLLGKEIRKLFEFIYENGIEDLHGGNIGYDYNGVPKFFDYSGV